MAARHGILPGLAKEPQTNVVLSMHFGSGKDNTHVYCYADLHTRFLDDLSVRVTYLYYNFRQHDEQTAVGFLASLLKQLI
jgi:hypothetical protein